jgi:Ni/Fe-hydrogenase subunit HybB-like protein
MTAWIKDLKDFCVGMLLRGGPRTNDRVLALKVVFWVLVGTASAVAAARFIRGLGATTALSDTTPWGLWISFDVLGGVALAAGGFVIAATVYIFHLRRYHAIVRPAVLTAFLGYAAVVGGLLFDLGLPWNIWRPTFFWNPHSALFEVAWCVMLYLTVLALEFAPVVLEKMPFPRVFRFFKKATLPLVILGIMLSTLHQSSLGTLFLIMPFRLHPLWYSPLEPLLFFISAVGLGLGMVTLESLTTYWLYGRKPEWSLLRGLARAASVVLFLYAAIRLGDLAVRGQLGQAADPRWESGLFVIEMLVASLLPAIFFAIPRLRESKAGLWSGALMIVAGFVLNRISVSGLATIAITRTHYFPAWTEFAVSLGVVAGAALAFLFFVERFSVYEEAEENPEEMPAIAPPAPDPVSGVRLSAPWAGAFSLYSLVFILAASLSAAVLTHKSDRAALIRTPVHAARVISADKSEIPDRKFQALTLPVGFHGGQLRHVLMLDGNGDGRFVLFDHEAHKERTGGKTSCGVCHHLNMPLDEATPCSQCHRDMYLPVSIFDHALHANRMGGNRSCSTCHHDPALPRSGATAKPCLTCHKGMATKNAEIKPAGNRLKDAPGYMQAMHGMCIRCHRQTLSQHPELTPDFARCTTCHRESDPDRLRQLPSYVQAPKFARMR